VAISGPAQTGVVVARGGVCSLVASFTPTTTDAFTAAVGFMDNSGAGSPQVVILNDAGTGMAPLPTIAPTSVSFGTQPVGITSGTQTVTLTNTGSASLQLTGIATTGSNSTNFGFLVKVAPPCPSPSGTLAAGASCTISVDFAPHAAEPVSATLSISDNATGSPQSVALSGTSGTSGISLTPASLNFASQTAGASSAPQVVNVNNTGTTPVAMTISIVGNNPGDFAETDNCSESPLAGGKTGVIIATFDPTQTGGRSADVLISDTASQNPQIVAVSGTAVQAAATISPAGTISFGSARAGTESAPVTVTITNSGTPPAMLTVRGATVNPYRNFTPTKNCTADVPASGNCTLTVTFSPPASPVAAPCGSDAGAKTATLTITDNSPTSPQNIALSGTATDFCLAPAGVTSQTFTAGNPVTHQHVADSLGTFRRRGRAHLHGRSIAQHVHSAAGDGEPYIGRASSHRAQRSHCDEQRRAVRQSSRCAAIRTVCAARDCTGLARNCTLDGFAALANIGLGLDCQTPVIARDAFRTNRRAGNSTFNWAGCVFWKRYKYRNIAAGRNDHRHLHDYGDGNIHGHRR
jgi:hypothetical protein